LFKRRRKNKDKTILQKEGSTLTGFIGHGKAFGTPQSISVLDFPGRALLSILLF
jgi:hypothetical protein